MSARRFNYKKKQNYKSGEYDYEVSSPFQSVDNDDADNDDYEYLQEVPYSSSSIDRSSIGSIPWADDAIKQNQLDWERVERMISGDEPLPDEPELRNEIEDWQRKFPHLLGKSNLSIQPSLPKEQLKSFDSNRTIDDIADDTLDADDSLTILSDNSLDDDKFDGFATPKQNELAKSNNVSHRFRFAAPTQKLYTEPNDLVPLLDRDLRITAIPLQHHRNTSSNKSKRYIDEKHQEQQRVLTASSIPSPNHAYLPTKQLLNTKPVIQSTNYTRIRMPPIPNGLESDRLFRGLVDNRSFVQLTEIYQAKSAAERQRNTTQLNTSWQVPAAPAGVSDRFFYNNNNRNSIILPAINMQSRTNERLSSNQVFLKSKNVRLNSSLKSTNLAAENRVGFIDRRQSTRTNSSITPSTARSISAAAHRSGFSNYYLPNSASKYKVFK